MNEIRTRFAPSPTGFLHIGGLRTALYSYAYAKSQGGKFILRIEDTDRRRFVPGATEKVYEILKKFGLSWDEGPLVGGPYSPYIQSERVATNIYKEAGEKLIKEGHAYYCFCDVKTKEELDEEEGENKTNLRDENCRNLTESEITEKINSGLKPAIRLRVPDLEVISYHDFIIDKDISWASKDIDEAMLLKSDGFPTYHLAVTIDDTMMKISHIIRGHDWLPSTPIHLLLMNYLNLERPLIGHLTDILDPEGGKLSKRKGSVSCEEMLVEGYLPEAILNFIMLLGWAPKDNNELFTLGEFVANFPLGNLQIANPIFNRQKLDWFNGVYLRKKTDAELLELIKDHAPLAANPTIIAKTIPLVKERINKLNDYSGFAGFFFSEPEPKKEDFDEMALIQLAEAAKVLINNTSWNKETLTKELQELINLKSWKTGQFFMNFRIAITGSKFTPPITDSIEILGKETTLKRLEKVINLIA